MVQPEKAVGNVSEIVCKAKKAAASLWTILHARSCPLSSATLCGTTKNTNERGMCCPHPGCGETKKVLLHIKTCPAAFDELPCPLNVQGCQSVRKLLYHYKTCRESRQQIHRVRSPPSRPRSQSVSSDPRQTNLCLVCALVARHAQKVLESSKGPSSVSIPAMLVNSVEESKIESSPPSHAKCDARVLPCFVTKPHNIERTNSMILMPPPPPRLPLFTAHGITQGAPVSRTIYPKCLNLMEALDETSACSTQIFATSDTDELTKKFDSSCLDSGFECESASSTK